MRSYAGQRGWVGLLVVLLAFAPAIVWARSRKGSGLPGQSVVFAMTLAALALAGTVYMVPFRARFALSAPDHVLDEFTIRSVEPDGCLAVGNQDDPRYFLDEAGVSASLLHCEGPTPSCPCDLHTTIDDLGHGWILLREAYD